MKDVPLKIKALWIMIALLAAANIIQTISHLSTIYPERKPVAFNFSGNRFAGLEKVLKNVKYAGYYTDLNINDPRPGMELLQAQYAVIPIILDPESIDHRYVIVNAANIPAAIEKFKALGARPLSGSHAGIFLVERPELQP
jgi:hypothetical protein